MCIVCTYWLFLLVTSIIHSTNILQTEFDFRKTICSSSIDARTKIIPVVDSYSKLKYIKLNKRKKSDDP